MRVNLFQRSFCRVLLFTALVGLLVGPVRADPPPGFGVAYTPMGKFGPWADMKMAKWSNDGMNFAFPFGLSTEDGPRFYWVVNGVVQKPYKIILVSAGWAPDGKTFIYGVQNGDDTGHAVLNGEELPLNVRGIGQPAFSADSKRYLFEATFSTGDGGWYHDLVVDGKPLGKRSLGMPHGTFSPDSKQFAYVEVTGEGQRVVVNDKPFLMRDGVLNDAIVFSPDSTKIAYQAEADGLLGLFVNEDLIGLYDKGFTAPVFSPDSKRVGVLCRIDNKDTCLIDGKLVEQDFFSVHDLMFSPDSKHYIFFARPIGEEPTYAVMDGKQLKHPYQDYGGIPEPMVFSKDCERWAIVGKIAGDNKNWYVVIDDELGPPQNQIALKSFQFSPDGKHYIYRAKFKKTWQLMKDHQQIPTPTSMLRAKYAPDGRLITIVETADQKGAEIYVDDQLIAAIDPPLKESEITFSNEKTFHIWTTADEKLTRVDVSLP